MIEPSEQVIYGDIWQRPGLSKRDRGLIVVATLIATYRPEQVRGRDLADWPDVDKAPVGPQPYNPTHRGSIASRPASTAAMLSSARKPIAFRVSTDALPTCGARITFSKVAKR